MKIILNILAKWFFYFMAIIILGNLYVAYREAFAPSEYGFMGDETPYQFEAILFFFYALFSIAPAIIWELMERYYAIKGHTLRTRLISSTIPLILMVTGVMLYDGITGYPVMYIFAGLLSAFIAGPISFLIRCSCNWAWRFIRTPK